MATTILTGTNISGSLTSTGSVGRLNFDGASGHTFIQETADDTLKIFVGGEAKMEFAEDSENIFMQANNYNFRDASFNSSFKLEANNNLFSGSLDSSGSFGHLRVQAKEDGTTIKTDRFGLTIDGQVGYYPLTVQSPYETAARFLSTDGTSAIEIGDNSSTTNYNRIQVVGDSKMEFFVNNQEIIKLGPSGNTTIFNEDSLDINFRFEGADDTHLFYLDAGKNHATIGANRGNTGDEKLLVAGNVGITGSLHVSGNISTSGSIIAKEFRTEFVNQIIATSSGSTTFGDTIDDVHRFTGSFFVTSSNVDIAGVQIDSNGDLNVQHLIEHQGNTNTYVQFTNDRLRFAAGGEVLLDLTEASQDVVKLGDGGDVDINLNDDMFLQGSTGNVGIGATEGNIGARLEVQAPTGSVPLQIRPSDPSTALNPLIQFRSQLNGTVNYLMAGNGGHLYFATYDSGTPTDVSKMIRFSPDATLSPKMYMGDDGSAESTFRVGGPSNGVFLLGGSSGSMVSSSLGGSGSLGYLRIEGLTAAARNLEVTGSAGFTHGLRLGRGNSNNRGLIVLEKNNNADDTGLAWLNTGGSYSATMYVSQSHGDFVFANTGVGGDLTTQNPNFVISASGDIRMKSGAKLLLDSADAEGHTYISETSDDNMALYAGGAQMMVWSEGTNDLVYTPDSVYLGVGNDVDFYMRHNGSNSFLTNSTGDFYITNDANDKDIILQSDDGSGGSTAYITLDGSATQTHLHQDTVLTGGKKLYLAGNTYITEASSDILDFYVGGVLLMKLTETGDGIEFPQDSHPLKIGAGSDLQFTHNGTDSFIDNYTGTLNITNNTDDGDIVLKSDDGSGGTTAYITLDGSVTKTIFNQDAALSATKKLYLDGGGNTYIYEDTADRLRFFVGGAEFMRFTEDTSDSVALYQDVNLTATKKLYLDGGSNTYIHEQSGDDLEIVVGGDVLAKFENDTIVLGGGYAVSSSLAFFGQPESPKHMAYGEFTVPDGGDGWYRIARMGTVSDGSSNGTRASAKFTVYDTDSSRHSVVTFYASIHFGSNPTIHIINSSDFSGIHGVIEQIRLVNGSTYEGVGVDVYINSEGTSAVRYVMEENYQDNGWTATNFQAVDADPPTGYTMTQISCSYNEGGGENNVIDGIAASNGNNTNGKVLSYTLANGHQMISGSDSTTLRVRDGSIATSDFINASGSFRANTSSQTIKYGLYGDDITNYGIGMRSGLSYGGLNDWGMTFVFNDDNDRGFHWKDAGHNDSQGAMSLTTQGKLVVATSIGVGAGESTTAAAATTLDVNGTSNFTDTIYIDHGGSDYSPNIQFMGGSNTPGSNTYENAGIGYYDNSGTGTMKFFGNRGAMNWTFNDDGDSLFLMASSGDFHANGDVIAASTTTSSDIRLKKNINDIPYGLSEVLQLRAVEFDWKEKRDGKHDIGVIAQEIEKIIPEVVQESKDLNSDTMYKNVDYGKLVAVLVEAVKEQQVQIEELKEDIKELKK